MYAGTLGKLKLLSDITTTTFAVNATQSLSKLPAISVSEQNDKLSQTELEKNVFLVH